MIVMTIGDKIAENYSRTLFERIVVEIAQTQTEAVILSDIIRKYQLHNLPARRSMMYQLMRRIPRNRGIKFNPEVPYLFKHLKKPFKRPACVIAILYTSDAEPPKGLTTVEPHDLIPVASFILNFRYTNHFTARKYRRKGYASLLWDAVIEAIPEVKINVLNSTNRMKDKKFFELNGIDTPVLNRWSR